MIFGFAVLVVGICIIMDAYGMESLGVGVRCC